MDIKWVNEPEPDDSDTREIVMLPAFENDTRRVCTMVSPNGHVVGQVRVGSLVYRVMISNGYKVLKS